MDTATQIFFFPGFIAHGAAYLLLRHRLSWLHDRRRSPPTAPSGKGIFADWQFLAFIFSDTYREVGDKWVTRAVWILRLTLPYLLFLIVAQAIKH